MHVRRLPAAVISVSAALVAAFAISSTARAGNTWDGGGSDDYWTTGANWNPASGPFQLPPFNNGAADIVMPAVTGLVQTPIVDVPYSIRSLTFNSDGGNGRFVILGVEELTIGAGGITNNDADIQSVIGPVKLSANQAWNAAAGALNMDAVNLNGFNLNFAGAHQIDLPYLTGTGNLTVSNAYTSTVTMYGGTSNTYAGDTSVENGTLVLHKTGGATAVPGDLFIGLGATVRLAANEQISDAPGNTVHVYPSGLLDLNGFTETLADLRVANYGSVTTGAGMLKIGQFLEVYTNGTITGNLGLGDVTAFVSSGGQVTTGSNLVIGDAGNGTLNIYTGGFVGSGAGYIGSLSGSTGAVTVNGLNSIWTNTNQLYVGSFGNGTLDISGGGHVSNAAGHIGARSTSTGSVTVDGSGSTWTNTSFLYVGEEGNGTLEISGGGKVESVFGRIGANPSSSGDVTVDGMNSIWTNTSSLVLGLVGSGFGGGTLTVTNGGMVSVGAGGITVFSTSQINITNGTLQGTGNLTIIGGSLTADANAEVMFAAGTFRQGALVTVQNGASVTQTGWLDLVSDATVEVNSGATYSVSDLVRVGITPGPASELLIDGQDTLVSSNFAIDVGYGGTGVMTVTNGARVVSGTGAVGSFDPNSTGSIGTVVLDGTDANGTPSSWTTEYGINMALSVNSQAAVSILHGALMDMPSLSVGNLGQATVTIDGADLSGNPSLLDVGNLQIGTGPYGNGTGVLAASNGSRINAGNISLAPSGGAATVTIKDTNTILVQSAPSTLTVGHATSGTATLNVRNNAKFTTGTGTINVYATGQINLESGAVFDALGPINMNGGQFNFLGGTLHVANFNGNLLNQGGTLAPGHSAGTTAVAGNYTQGPSASLQIEIGGVLPGQWDQVTIEGNAILEGTLVVSLLNGFQPVLGNSFTILTTNVGNVAGPFDIEILPPFNGLSFDVVYNAKSVVLQVIEAPLVPGDFDSDGDVDGADFVVWQTNFPFPSGPGAAPVPEPAAWLLGLVGLVGLTKSVRRRSR